MAITFKITPEHENEAVANLITQFRAAPNFEAMIRAYVAKIQVIEDAFKQIKEEMNLETAIGDQLDGIGTIVNRPRAGQDDDQYRTYLRAQILINKSQGTIEEIIHILDTLTGGASLIEYRESAAGLAHFDIYLRTPVPANVNPVLAMTLTLSAKPAGVRGVGTFFTGTPFAFETAGRGFETTGAGFAASIGD